MANTEIFRWVRELGIPSVMCMALGWFVWYQNERNYQLGQATQTLIMAELKASTAAITKSTDRDDKVSLALEDAARSKEKIAVTIDRLCVLVENQNKLISVLADKERP